MIRRFLALAATALSLGALPVQAAPLSVQTSFRIGTAGVLCTAQVRPIDPATHGTFDRAYAIVCRDAATSVGRLYALRAGGSDAMAGIVRARSDYRCDPATPTPIEGLTGVVAAECRSPAKVAYKSYSLTSGGVLYVAEGLAGYDSALRLALRTIVADRPVPGTVEVATTAAGDPAAFARVQAGSLDADAALTEAYQRNNSGSFAEAAQFFAALSARSDAGDTRSAEFLANQALQESNLGNFPSAATLFNRAAAATSRTDPIATRLLRNYRAMDAINRGRADTALAELAKPVAPIAGANDTSLSEGRISPALADQINRENTALNRMGIADTRLRASERAAILDAQALQIKGIALRLVGRYGEARTTLEAATRGFAGVRGGRIASAAFMASETFAELALIAEAQKDYGAAERDFGQAVAVLAENYPRSAALLIARARLAAYLQRRGDTARAMALYAEVVSESAQVPGAAVAMRNLLEPYFALLAPAVGKDPKAAEAMFAVSQVMLRPGLAQTQAVLARALSAGDDDAARLFRESLNLSREVARAEADVATQAAANPPADSPAALQLAAARTRLEGLASQQTTLQSKLADYPRYRVLVPQTLTVAELQKTLRAGEAYYQLRIVGADAYAMLITPDRVSAQKVAATTRELDDMVAKLRDSIVKVENGRTATYPFDVALSHRLYAVLFGGFGEPLAGVTHLIYEPDGPLLQLPASLLVMDQASVDTYSARAAKVDGDPFDFTGIRWLGRDRDVTTSVSPRSFADVRAVPPSKAKRAYLGLGHNAPPGISATLLSVPKAPIGGRDCSWPMSAWLNPIAATELTLASNILGQQQSEVVTGAAFSDSAIKAMPDLRDFRVIHFATHGLVTAPHPDCPAEPALLTSFGGGDSDGLLTFREIYDLDLDADVVVLSACDTAGMATIEATREAGVTTGGNFALDGLVRAFVGAGARTVIASHWPVPDDYDATKRLILGLFQADPGTPMAAALRTAEAKLMDDPNTSHPYYWSAFAIVGDGEHPMLPKK